jgi:phytoene dehydrogenase-like protein
MREKSVIIIGAGLAGLSVGCYAQMNGYHTHILEHHTTPGGVAACWRRKGYLIDGGIHFIMNCRPGSEVYEMYRELGTAQANRFVEMDTYVHFVDEASGRKLSVTSDLERLADEMKTHSPSDAALIDELMDRARATRGLDMGKVGMGKPPELTGPMDWLKLAWGVRRFLRYFVGKYQKPVEEYMQDVHDPWLRFVLENMFMPEVPVWFLFMLLGMLPDRQMGLAEGGSLGFVLPIEKRYHDLGGTVSYKSTVQEILVEEDRAVGVRLGDGTEHLADVVVSAADGYSTIFKMLGGRYVDQRIERMYRDWKLIRPTIMVSLGLAREFTGEPWLSTIRLGKPFRVGRQEIGGISLRIFNYSDRFAPPGKTVVQVIFETEWQHWKDLRNDPQAYNDEKERVAAEVVDRLEHRYPGISGRVELTDVATPFTTWRYTLNHEGAYMGWLPTPDVLTTMVRRTLPGLDNFIMAGQWVVPGGGVPGCLYSGRHVAQILCHRDGKPFVTSVP